MHRGWWALFAGVMLLGAALRLHGISERSFWYDEAAQIRLSNLVDSPSSLMDLDQSNDPPLYPVLVRAWREVVGDVLGFAPGTAPYDGLLRLLPCAFGVLCVGLTFLLARATVRDNTPALVAAFLCAISPFQIYYSQDLRPYSLHAALNLAAVLFLLKAFEENRIWHWAGLTVSLVLAIYNQFFTVWIVIALNLYFVLTIRAHWHLLGRWIICNLAVILLSMPALEMAFAISRVFEQAQVKWYPYPDLRIALITFKDFFAGYTPDRSVYMALFGLGAVLLVLGGCGLLTKPKALVFLVVFGFAPIVANVLYWQHKTFPYYSHRLMIASAVPCYILAAQGMFLLRKRMVAGIAAGVFTAGVFTALTIPALADHYAHRIHPSWDHVFGALYKVQNREAAHHVRDRLADGDVVAHRTRITLLPFRYYIDGNQTQVCFTEGDRLKPTRGYPHLPLYENWGNMPKPIQAVASPAKRLWFVQSYFRPFKNDPYSRLLVAWLDGHCLQLERTPFDGLTVYLYNNDQELRAATATNRLADRGAYHALLHYVFPDTEEGRAANAAWKDQWVSSCIRWQEEPPAHELRFDLAVVEAGGSTREHGTMRIGDTDYSVLAVDNAGRRVAAGSFPLRASDGFTYEIVVTNPDASARTVECRVFESAETLGPLSFNHADLESKVWLPALRYNPGPPPGLFDTVNITATMHAETPDGHAIYRDVRLDPGQYDVYVRGSGDAQPQNTWCADARFWVVLNDGREHEIGFVRGNDPSGTGGWRWRKVGKVDSEGEPMRLHVAAYNTDHLDTAYFSFDRVLFAPAESAFEKRRFGVDIQPFAERRVPLTGRLDGRPTKRVEIETFDPATNEFRTIWFYVCHVSE